MIITLSIIILITLAVFVFMQQSQFGKAPSGERLEKIKMSPNYKDGAFQNQEHTPVLTEGTSYTSMLKEFFFSTNKRPLQPLPSTKTNLLTLDRDKDILVWFGHSSYFMQIDGKRILVDPVFSGSASPISFTAKAFEGTDRYTTEDIPEIDYLFITHDHWDHLDYKTIRELNPKIKKVITGLGTGEHLESWGYDKNIIIEKDWNEEILLDSGFMAYTTTARHFSGRGFTRNKSLWLSFVFQSPTMKIFIGGDSGYGKHFVEIGKQFGVFDLAILENGQYDRSWKYIHTMPEQALQAAKDLGAKRLFPVHSAKFALANHAWDTPLKEITEANKIVNMPLVTPIVGELVNLKDTSHEFSQWWRDIK
ncbi:MAG: MBL fold metallo-hydrolase [Bacteroidales bacterium]|nr:MBL fold metallo-hydrolase [Bacteroidales bacterium]MCF8458227.1 MBL fold metallo-hydrolase [Bacteroidales bacterium]